MQPDTRVWYPVAGSQRYDLIMNNQHAAQIVRQVAANVRTEIFRLGRTQDDAAAWLGIGQSSLSRRLTGEVPFKVHELVLIAENLGVPVGKFFENAR